MTAPPSAPLQSLVEELQRHPVNTNAFFQAFAAQRLTMSQLRVFLRQYQYFCNRFVKLLEGLLYHTPLEQVEMRSRLIQTLHSELGSGCVERAHISLLNRFARAAGLTEDDLTRTVPVAEVQRYLDLLSRLFTQSSYLVALGAEMAVEITAGAEFRFFEPTLKKYYHFAPDEIEFFTLHLSEEDCHSAWLIEAVQRTARTQADLDLVAAGARETADGWLAFWNGIYREVFARHPAPVT
ncbi:TenA family transcriptional regulator [Nitrospira sp. Kam-Ns4a]